MGALNCSFLPAGNVIKPVCMFQLQLSVMWASSGGNTVSQSGSGQSSESNQKPSNKNDQIPDDVLCIPIQAQTITSVCCCPAALTYAFGFINLSGLFYGFDPGNVYSSYYSSTE